ncbi:MAG: hypothetical protein HY707_00375 [Ignavibacteriae bacterium]|nr:hypothetical protein [Ignavibacteriota bacterium]
MRHFFIVLALCSLFLSTPAYAQPPQTISYQGFLSSSGVPLNGTYALTFRLYQVPAGGTVLWEETHAAVPVQNGTFNVILGGTTSLSGIDFAQQLYLGITEGSNAEFSPRAELTSAPSAFVSNAVKGTGDVTTSGVIDATGQSSKIRFYYDFLGDLPDANTYHGAVAHVHATGLLYYAHDGQWFPLSAEGHPHSTLAASDGTPSDAVSVDADGNVGIGTTSPEKKLEVTGSVKVSDTLFATNVSSNSPLRLQTAGTTRMYIDDAAGKIGIGTSAPGAQLDVSGSNPEIMVSNPTNNQLNSGKLIFREGSTDAFTLRYDATLGSKRLYLDTKDVANAFVVDRLTGNVGIGLTNPRAALEVSTPIANGSYGGIRITNKSIPETTGKTMVEFFDEDALEPSARIASDRFLSGTVTANLMFDVADLGGTLQERMRIKGNGNVGIGTTNPAYKLDVAGPIRTTESGARLIYLGESIIGDYWGGPESGDDFVIHNSAWDGVSNSNYGEIIGGHFYSYGGIDIGSGSGQEASSNGLYVAGQSELIGNVGIGTTTPNAPLGFPPVLGKKITLYPGATGDVGFGVQGNLLQIYADHPNADIALGYDQAGVLTERMRIKGSGNVGIGTTTPSYPLHVTTTGSGAAWFDNNSTSGSATGLWGYADGAGGTTHYGVYGYATGATTNYGIYGFASGGTTNYGIYNAAGTKNWANPHPKDPTKSIVYVTLEGGENGAYYRGTAKLVNGKATVVLPEHFQLATSSDSYVNVTVTPNSRKSKGLAVVERSNSRFTVEELFDGEGNYEFDYMVVGIRRGYETWEPITDVLDYVPFYGNHANMDEGKTSTQDFYDGQSEGLKKLFISNGLLNPDGTVNRETFREYGWRIVEKNHLQVEVDKPNDERSKYFHPKEFGQPALTGIDYEMRPDIIKKHENK